jgi:hypothetical protein
MFKLETEWKWSLQRDVLPTDFVAVTYYRPTYQTAMAAYAAGE